jgi:PIN domain nuclease of toxin-antitoxin system
MRALIDTHTFLWFILGDSQLSASAKGLIEDPTNDIEISPAS